MRAKDMTTLFDIESYLLELQREFESGNISEDQYKDTLEAVQAARDQKLENIAKLIVTYDEYADLCHRQADALYEKQKTWERRAESLRKFAAYFLPDRGWTNGAFSMRFHHSVSTEPDQGDGLEGLAEEFINTQVTRKPKRTEILRALKAKVAVPGWHLKENRSVVVK